MVIFQRQEELIGLKPSLREQDSIFGQCLSGSSDDERIGLRDAAKILLAHSHFFSGKKPAQDK